MLVFEIFLLPVIVVAVFYYTSSEQNCYFVAFISFRMFMKMLCNCVPSLCYIRYCLCGLMGTFSNLKCYLLFIFSSFLPIFIAAVSRPSVCPSVCNVEVPQAYMLISSKIITRIISLGCSLLGATTYGKVNTPKIRVELGWGRSS